MMVGSKVGAATKLKKKVYKTKIHIYYIHHRLVFGADTKDEFSSIVASKKI